MQLDANCVVAYYLSRFTLASESGRSSKPPKSLGVSKWDDAFMLFFPRLRNGRSASQYRNSLKNRRETVDPFFPGNRVGWYQKAPPANVQLVIDTLSDKTEEEILSMIEPFMCHATTKYSLVELDSALDRETIPCLCCIRRYGRELPDTIDI